MNRKGVKKPKLGRIPLPVKRSGPHKDKKGYDRKRDKKVPQNE